MTSNRLVALDLPEANAMRAPNEAPGLAALEIAIDEMAEKLGMDPVEFRIVNDTQVVPDNPGQAGVDRPAVEGAATPSTIRIRRSRSGSSSNACARARSASAGTSATRKPGQRARRPLARRHGRGRGLSATTW